MNKEYCYGNNQVIINTGAKLKRRDYVDNLDDILTTENNIEILEARIKSFTYALNYNNIEIKNSNRILYALIAFGIVSGLVAFFISIGSLAIVKAIKLATIFCVPFVSTGLLVRLALSHNGANKKNNEKLKNRISVSKSELEKEKAHLKELNEKSKKIEVPKTSETVKLPLTFHIDNLKFKLFVVEKFKLCPDIFVEEYNNGTIDDILGDLGCTNMEEGIQLVKYLVDEYQKEQNEKQNSKGKTKRKNK